MTARRRFSNGTVAGVIKPKRSANAPHAQTLRSLLSAVVDGKCLAWGFVAVMKDSDGETQIHLHDVIDCRSTGDLHLMLHQLADDVKDEARDE